MSENYDQAYREADFFGAEASPLLKRFSGLFEKGSTVLDLGVGQGRNALPPARAGCRVTGIDPSGVAVAGVNELATAEALGLEARQIGFAELDSALEFDFVFCFGLLQMIDPAAGDLLLRRLAGWTRPGGVLFLTAWHRDDPSFAHRAASWTELEPGRFRSSDDPPRYRRYLDSGEIETFFPGWEILHHFEGPGPWHRHAGGPPERHADVDWVARRPV